MKNRRMEYTMRSMQDLIITHKNVKHKKKEEEQTCRCLRDYREVVKNHKADSRRICLRR